jgi:UPF0176 protein
MEPHTLLLYYILRPLADPEALGLWQRELCVRLGLRGRVVVSPQGMHGVVYGGNAALAHYACATKEHPALAALQFRGSQVEETGVPGLEVTVQDELVAFGAAAELQIGTDGVIGGGRRLTPRQLHALLAARGREVVLLDGRNRYEAEIGRFRGAVAPDVNAARELLEQLDGGRFDHLKDRPVVTYSTGGVRSEILSTLMVNRGFREVYQLDGGIVSYGRDFADDGLWQGALYVLDDRVRIAFSDHPAVLGCCEACGAGTHLYRECVAPLCRGRALLCNACADFPLCAAHRN